MTAIAYIVNEFPSPLEPYVMDEIIELRRRGSHVICCSGKRVAPQDLALAERVFWKETLYFQPLSDTELSKAVRRLTSHRARLWPLLRPLLWERGASPSLRVRAVGHTVMGAALAEQLASLKFEHKVEHIHAHHGYFSSWMALTAAHLLGIGFSFTLHGSDLLQRADLLAAKLRACDFCVTVSEFNRQYILRNYQSSYNGSESIASCLCLPPPRPSRPTTAVSAFSPSDVFTKSRTIPFSSTPAPPFATRASICSAGSPAMAPSARLSRNR